MGPKPGEWIDTRPNKLLNKQLGDRPLVARRPSHKPSIPTPPASTARRSNAAASSSRPPSSSRQPSLAGNASKENYTPAPVGRVQRTVNNQFFTPPVTDDKGKGRAGEPGKGLRVDAQSPLPVASGSNYPPMAPRTEKKEKVASKLKVRQDFWGSPVERDDDEGPVAVKKEVQEARPAQKSGTSALQKRYSRQFGGLEDGTPVSKTPSRHAAAPSARPIVKQRARSPIPTPSPEPSSPPAPPAAPIWRIASSPTIADESEYMPGDTQFLGPLVGPETMNAHRQINGHSLLPLPESANKRQVERKEREKREKKEAEERRKKEEEAARISPASKWGPMGVTAKPGKRKGKERAEIRSDDHPSPPRKKVRRGAPFSPIKTNALGRGNSRSKILSRPVTPSKPQRRDPKSTTRSPLSRETVKRRRSPLSRHPARSSSRHPTRSPSRSPSHSPRRFSAKLQELAQSLSQREPSPSSPTPAHANVHPPAPVAIPTSPAESPSQHSAQFVSYHQSFAHISPPDIVDPVNKSPFLVDHQQSLYSVFPSGSQGEGSSRVQAFAPEKQAQTQRGEPTWTPVPMNAETLITFSPGGSWGGMPVEGGQIGAWSFGGGEVEMRESMGRDAASQRAETQGMMPPPRQPHRPSQSQSQSTPSRAPLGKTTSIQWSPVDSRNRHEDGPSGWQSAGHQSQPVSQREVGQSQGASGSLWRSDMEDESLGYPGLQETPHYGFRIRSPSTSQGSVHQSSQHPSHQASPHTSQRPSQRSSLSQHLASQGSPILSPDHDRDTESYSLDMGDALRETQYDHFRIDSPSSSPVTSHHPSQPAPRRASTSRDRQLSETVSPVRPQPVPIQKRKGRNPRGEVSPPTSPEVLVPASNRVLTESPKSQVDVDEGEEEEVLPPSSFPVWVGGGEEREEKSPSPTVPSPRPVVRGRGATKAQPKAKSKTTPPSAQKGKKKTTPATTQRSAKSTPSQATSQSKGKGKGKGKGKVKDTVQTSQLSLFAFGHSRERVNKPKEAEFDRPWDEEEDHEFTEGEDEDEGGMSLYVPPEGAGGVEKGKGKEPQSEKRVTRSSGKRLGRVASPPPHPSLRQAGVRAELQRRAARASAASSTAASARALTLTPSTLPLSSRSHASSSSLSTLTPSASSASTIPLAAEDLEDDDYAPVCVGENRRADAQPQAPSPELMGTVSTGMGSSQTTSNSWFRELPSSTRHFMVDSSGVESRSDLMRSPL
ncbi:hypothetical protein IAT38_002043 [Cryptococcus sp. DSM 104549]